MNKELSLLQKLEKAAQERKLEKFTSSSYEWYRGKARSVAGGSKLRNDIIKEQTKRGFALDRSPAIGNMYTYIYDAKHKDTLPYWDAFPLIFLVGPAEGGYFGLNLHYIPPKLRAKIMDFLIGFANNTKYDNKTKLTLSYQLLKSSSKMPILKSAFKRYLYSQMGSKLVKIPSSEWEAALYLPTANFQGASNSKVWSDTVLNSK
jgi:hypothetical protein